MEFNVHRNIYKTHMSHTMAPWDKQKPYILPTATVGILTLLVPLQTDTLQNRHLLPRQIQVSKYKWRSPSRQIQVENTNSMTKKSVINPSSI